MVNGMHGGSGTGMVGHIAKSGAQGKGRQLAFAAWPARDDSMFLICFNDNGVAIPPDTRALIFEKFARINDQDGSGAGLGLAICREIMLRLGGEIEYVPAKTGNQFAVWLPLNT